jgi:hypothetical protein
LYISYSSILVLYIPVATHGHLASEYMNAILSREIQFTNLNVIISANSTTNTQKMPDSLPCNLYSRINCA